MKTPQDSHPSLSGFDWWVWALQAVVLLWAWQIQWLALGSEKMVYMLQIRPVGLAMKKHLQGYLQGIHQQKTEDQFAWG